MFFGDRSVERGRLGKSSGTRDRCARFGERFSYCDPQIPAPAGVRPCVCFSVSWVELSDWLLVVVLGYLELASGRSPQPVFARSCRNGIAFRGNRGVGWSPASVEDIVVLGVVGRVWSVFVARVSGGIISFEVPVGPAFGRPCEAPIAGAAGRCRWDCRSKRLRWLDSATSPGRHPAVGRSDWRPRRVRRLDGVGFGPARSVVGYLVDPASSHMLVSKTKPCMCKYKRLNRETANGSLNQL